MPPHGQWALHHPPKAQRPRPTSLLRRALQHAQDGIGFFEYTLGVVSLLFGPSRGVRERPLVPWRKVPLFPQSLVQ